MPAWDLLQQPEPDFEFDQRVSWYPPSPAGGGAKRLRLAAVRHDPEPAHYAASVLRPETSVARGRSAMFPALDLTSEA